MPLPIQATNYLTKVTGRPFLIRYYTFTIGSIWDDERTLTQSGTDFYTSGTWLQVNITKGSQEAVFLEEGKLKYGDRKLIISGGIQLGSSSLVYSITESGTNVVYRPIEIGAQSPQYTGINAYHLIYLREGSAI